MKETAERLYKLAARAVHLMDETEELHDDVFTEYDHSDYVLPAESREALKQAYAYEMRIALEHIRSTITMLTEAMVYAEEKEPDDDDTEEEPGDEAFPGKYWTGDDAESPEKPI